MKYELCSYDVHEKDLEIVKEIANNLDLKLNVGKSGRLINHGIWVSNADKEKYFTVWFDEIEVESYEKGDDFEEHVFWKLLQEKSTDVYLLRLLNS